MMTTPLRVNKVESYSNMLQQSYCSDSENVYIWLEADVIKMTGTEIW